MDVNYVLAWITGASCAFMLFGLLKSPSRPRGWVVVCLLVPAVMAAPGWSARHRRLRRRRAVGRAGAGAHADVAGHFAGDDPPAVHPRGPRDKVTRLLHPWTALGDAGVFHRAGRRTAGRPGRGGALLHRLHPHFLPHRPHGERLPLPPARAVGGVPAVGARSASSMTWSPATSR